MENAHFDGFVKGFPVGSCCIEFHKEHSNTICDPNYYLYGYTHVHTHTHARTHTYTHTHAHAHTHTHTHTRIHIYTINTSANRCERV